MYFKKAIITDETITRNYFHCTGCTTDNNTGNNNYHSLNVQQQQALNAQNNGKGCY